MLLNNTSLFSIGIYHTHLHLRNSFSRSFLLCIKYSSIDIRLYTDIFSLSNFLNSCHLWDVRIADSTSFFHRIVYTNFFQSKLLCLRFIVSKTHALDNKFSHSVGCKSTVTTFSLFSRTYRTDTVKSLSFDTTQK